MNSKLLTLFVSILLITSCASSHYKSKSRNTNSQTLNTAYDYQLLDNNYQPISLQKLSQSLTDADVVFVGEFHSNHASHLLEMQVLAALFQQNQKANRPMVLSMEMFNRDQQAILDDYLDSKIGERYLIDKAPAWGNYKASYRPLVEFAKQHKLAVIAANAPADIVRCIGRQGSDYLVKLDDEEKFLIAKKPIEAVENYDTKFFNLMSASSHTPTERQKNSYFAQLTRDNTMAESIQKALQENPSVQVLHLNGNFHSENQLGTVGALKKLMPELKIKVVTAVHHSKLAEQKKKLDAQDDFYYLVKKQPVQFVNKDFQREAFKKMFAKSKDKAKSCK